MATLKGTRKFNCFNDCRMQGCPGHEMEVLIQTVSDVMIVTIDGEDWFSSDPARWETLNRILDGLDYVQFPPAVGDVTSG